MALDLDARLTTAQAACHLGVAKATVNQWYYRGRLPGTTENKAGEREHLLRELLDAERDTRRSPNSSRSLTRRGIDLVSV